MLASLAVTSPWELNGKRDNNGFFHLGNWELTAWAAAMGWLGWKNYLQETSTSTQHLVRLLLCTLLCAPFEVHAGTAKLLGHQEISGEYEEGRGRREGAESEGFPGRNTDSVQHNDSSCMNASCLSAIQWMLGKFPQKNTISCQLICFRTLVLIILRLNFSFLLDGKLSCFLPQEKKKTTKNRKKPCCFTFSEIYIFRNSPQSKNSCFLLVLWVRNSHVMPEVSLDHLW